MYKGLYHLQCCNIMYANVLPKFNKHPKSYNVWSQFGLHWIVFLEKMVIRVNVRQQFYNKSLNKDDGGITERKISISILQ